MKFKPNEIFKKYPEIEDIAIRLDESEKESKEKEKNKNKGTESGNGTVPGQRLYVYTPEHAVISYFYKDGRWEQTPYTLKIGRENFLKDLAKILETRNPDAIKVEIYRGKTRKTEPIYSKDIYLSDSQPSSSPDADEQSGELGSLVKKFGEKLTETKESPDASNLKIELLRKDFEAQLTEHRHNSTIKDLNHQHQSEINGLQAIITQKDEYIEELEGQLDDTEGELNGLHEESKKVKDSPLGEIILSRVLTQAGENLLKQNPKILKIGLGLSEDEVKKIFESDPKKLEAGKADDSSSFSESTSADDYKGLDEKHAQGIKDLIGFFKQIKVEEFKKLFTILSSTLGS